MTQDVKINDLIESLSKDVPKGQKWSHPFLGLSPIALFLPLYTIAAAYFIGFRDDLGAALQNITLKGELMMSALMGLSSVLALGWLRYPDMRQQKSIMFPAFIFASLFLSHALYRLIAEGIQFADYEMIRECYVHSLILTTLPIMVLLGYQKSGYTTQPRLTSLMSVLAVTGFAWIGLRLTCHVDLAAHNILIQLSPFVALGLVLGAVSRKIFQW